MKKVLSLVLAAGLLLAASLANADTKRLTLATGGTSGVYSVSYTHLTLPTSQQV